MTAGLTAYAQDKSIKYFLISFTDLFGVQRSKLVPTEFVGAVQQNGAGFAGFAAHLDMSPADADIWATPDPDSVIQLPWKPDVAWVAADLSMNGEQVEHAPRVVLRRVLRRAADEGYLPKTGVECEFHLVQMDGSAISDPLDTLAKPCYDQQALMRQYDVISEICNSMLTLGWGAYQNDHEDANGQFEMNWSYDKALVTADRHAFYKFMVKSIAEKHGLRATFMPKPFPDQTGNGCHTHMSWWDHSGERNLFLDQSNELGLSKLAYNALGGIVCHAPALAAITNPTVNSYKRINAPTSISGATWAPNKISYGGNNRTHLVRIPEAGRFEVRLVDGAANPYLLQASLVAAGLDGVQSESDPGTRLDVDMYKEGHKYEVETLPLNLFEALCNLDKSQVFRTLLGESFVDSFVKLKTAEWNSYLQHFTSWELENTLDC